MRVTNSMLVSNYINDLNTNMNKLAKLQTQLANNRKFASISDDPVSAIYAMQAQFRLDRLERYQKGLEMSQSWLTQAETSVMELNEIYKSAYEQVVYASTNVKTDDDRARMAEYIKGLRDQLFQALNTSFGNKYIFAGYNTTGAYPTGSVETPFQVAADGHIWLNGFDLTAFVPNYDSAYTPGLNPGAPGYDAVKEEAAAKVGKLADAAGIAAAGSNYDPDYDHTTINIGDPDYDPDKETAALNYLAAYNQFISDYDTDYADRELEYNTLNGEMLEFWVGNGLTMEAQINGIQLVGVGEDNLYAMLDNLYKLMTSDMPLENMVLKLQEFIPKLQAKQGDLLSVAAELGGRANRLEMMADRYEQDYLNYIQLKSDAQDADEAELIMMYKMAESVYKAALATGSYVIQQTLMDFLR